MKNLTWKDMTLESEWANINQDQALVCLEQSEIDDVAGGNWFDDAANAAKNTARRAVQVAGNAARAAGRGIKSAAQRSYDLYRRSHGFH